jgi:hypothetical protein
MRTITDDELRQQDVKMLYHTRVMRGCYVRDMQAEGKEPDPEFLKQFDWVVELYRGFISKK